MGRKQPCRHHISEVLLRAAFELKVMQGSLNLQLYMENFNCWLVDASVKVSHTVGPDVKIFKSFKNNWNNLNHDRYKSGLRDKYVMQQLEDENLVNLSIRISEQMKKKVCRYDYREFFELCPLFIGETLLESRRRKSTFQRPGAMHHARWIKNVHVSGSNWLI